MANKKNTNVEDSIFNNDASIYDDRDAKLDDVIGNTEEIEETDDDTTVNNKIKDSVESDEFDVDLIESVKVDKDLKHKLVNMAGMNRREIKTVVDLYYQVQKDRIALENQIRAIKQEYDEDAPDNNNLIVLDYLLKNMKIMETNTANIIKQIVNNDPVGRWLVQIKGIAEILAAGLLAYFDVEGKNYASHFISYAGLNDQNRPWLGTEKATAIVNDIIGKSKVITNDHIDEIALRTKWSYKHILNHAYDQEKEKWSKDKIIAACAMVPYNRNLKKLMYKVGASFVWQCNKPDSLYGRLFNERKQYEMERNEAGEYADQAANILATKKYGKSTVAYKAYSEGKLPKAHIISRSMRYAEKIFLSHLFEEMYRVRYNQIPPRYYTLEHCDGHHDEIQPEVPYTLVDGEF